MSINPRAERIIAKLDELMAELVDLAQDDRAKDTINDLRTHAGFIRGGWVGYKTLSDLLDGGSFPDPDSEEDEDEDE